MRDHRQNGFPPTTISMSDRAVNLLQLHLRSLDPAEPTARQRLEEAVGESLAHKLLFALRAKD
jgi:hypothetical protein